jgi:hypothetical protein
MVPKLSAVGPSTGIEPLVDVRDGALGKGIYARRPISAGEQILEFTGRVLTLGQVLLLSEEAQAYPLQVGPYHYIDLESPGRFANHSCDPNAGISDDRILVALRAIAEGDEICFDYSTTMSEGRWTMKCRCGRPICRGLVQDFHFLPGAVQTGYLHRGIVQNFVVREWQERQARRRARGSVRAHDTAQGP